MVVLAMPIILYSVFSFIKYGSVSKIQIFLFIFVLILLISTAFGSLDFLTFIKIYIKLLVIALYTEILVKSSFKEFLYILSTILYILIASNFVSSIMFSDGFFNPDGLTAVYLLGNDNTTTILLVLGVLFIWLKSIFFNGKLDFYSLSSMAMVIITYVKDWSVTPLIGACMLPLYICFIYKRNISNKVYNMRNILVIYFLLFIMVVILRVQNMFQIPLETIFHKSVTLTGRTNIWDKVITHLTEHPILGMGVEAPEVRLDNIGIYHAHNTILNILLEGGAMGLASFINIFIQIYNRNKDVKLNEISKIIIFGFIVFSIVSLVEVYQDSQMLVIFIILAYYISEISRSYNYRKEKNEENTCSN